MDPPASSCMRNSHSTSTVFWECLRNHYPESGTTTGPHHYPQAPFSFHPKTGFSAYMDFPTSYLAAAPQSVLLDEQTFDEYNLSFQHPTCHFTTSEGRWQLSAELALGSGEPENGNPHLVDSAVGASENDGLLRNTSRDLEKKSCRRKKGNIGRWSLAELSDSLLWGGTVVGSST